MRKYKWQIILGCVLIGASILFYFFHYLIFEDAHHIFIYLVGDIAFVPIEVLLVTIIIHRLLSIREKRAMLNKLNMVIGAFFSEVGIKLMSFFSAFDPYTQTISQDLIPTTQWTEEEFSQVSHRLKSYDYKIEIKKGELKNLSGFLQLKRDFLLGLLQNPNLLEHESFTQLLWAVFHLTEELVHRDDVQQLPDKDYDHLSGDIRRAYRLLVAQWIEYMEHLKDNYPYLFSLAVRTNPFDNEASPVIK
jgi:tetrahydromethanopterin S-methyltransferase subunit G